VLVPGAVVADVLALPAARAGWRPFKTTAFVIQSLIRHVREAMR
jgi:hypothetical protein